MLCYKQLWTVEQTFRTAKQLFATRPIFHKLDETIRGHVFCSFLALVLKTALEERAASKGIALLQDWSSWASRRSHLSRDSQCVANKSINCGRWRRDTPISATLAD